jgi:hypothetical protein
MAVTGVLSFNISSLPSDAAHSAIFLWMVHYLLLENILSRLLARPGKNADCAGSDMRHRKRNKQ